MELITCNNKAEKNDQNPVKWGKQRSMMWSHANTHTHTYHWWLLFDLPIQWSKSIECNQFFIVFFSHCFYGVWIFFYLKILKNKKFFLLMKLWWKKQIFFFFFFVLFVFLWHRFVNLNLNCRKLDSIHFVLFRQCK